MKELSETVSELIAAFETPDIPGAPVAVEAEVETMVELSFVFTGGEYVALAAPPSSRFVSGLMAPVQRMRVRATRSMPADGENP